MMLWIENVVVLLGVSVGMQDRHGQCVQIWHGGGVL